MAHRTRKALREELPPWGVLVLESHHAPGFSMEWRTHAFVKVIYALSGRGLLHIEGDQYEFGRRDTLVVPPGCANRVVDDPVSASSLYVFCLSSDLLQFDPGIVGRLPRGRLRASGRFANQVERRLRRLLFSQAHRTEGTPITMVAESLQLVDLLQSQGVAGPEADRSPAAARQRAEVAVYVDYLNRHFFEATTIDAAADQLGIPRRNFTRIFRELTGRAWLEYVRTLAVQHAAGLLETTTLPIASVAFECGFEDLSTFYRWFRRVYGRSPAAWRDGA